MHGANLHLRNLNRRFLAIALLLAFAAQFLAAEGEPPITLSRQVGICFQKTIALGRIFSRGL